jgi:hypothetical protein
VRNSGGVKKIWEGSEKFLRLQEALGRFREVFETPRSSGSFMTDQEAPRSIRKLFKLLVNSTNSIKSIKPPRNLNLFHPTIPKHLAINVPLNLHCRPSIVQNETPAQPRCPLIVRSFMTNRRGKFIRHVISSEDI